MGLLLLFAGIFFRARDERHTRSVPQRLDLGEPDRAAAAGTLDFNYEKDEVMATKTSGKNAGKRGDAAPKGTARQRPAAVPI